MADNVTEWLDVRLDDPDAVIASQVCVTQYLDGAGTRFCVTTKGSASVSTLLGLLALAQHDLLLENDQAADDEDPE